MSAQEGFRQTFSAYCIPISVVQPVTERFYAGLHEALVNRDRPPLLTCMPNG